MMRIILNILFIYEYPFYCTEITVAKTSLMPPLNINVITYLSQLKSKNKKKPLNISLFKYLKSVYEP